MIVTDAGPGLSGAVRAPGGGPATGWVCLARRGMLHSECEGVDVLRLDAGAELGGRGRDGLCEAWYVVDGEGELDTGEPVEAGHLILRGPEPAGAVLRARTTLTLLTVSVLPDGTADRLPRRVPEMDAPTVWP